MFPKTAKPWNRCFEVATPVEVSAVGERLSPCVEAGALKWDRGSDNHDQLGDAHVAQINREPQLSQDIHTAAMQSDVARDAFTRDYLYRCAFLGAL